MNIPHDVNKYVRRFENNGNIIAALDEVGWKPGAADLLRRLNLVLEKGNYRSQFFENMSVDSLAGWFIMPPVSNRVVETLQNLQLLPTPEVLAFIENGGTKQGLDEIMERIRNGGLDISNQLHIELEYSDYKLNGPPMGYEDRNNLSLADLSKLPFIENQKVIFSEDEKEIAEQTAKEAIEVLRFITERLDENIPTLVIGNKRYGSLFVVRPIEPYLHRLGVKVVHEYVSSYVLDCDPERVPRISEETNRYIAEKEPNIIVVDGTKGSLWMYKDKTYTRFPAAMQGYINALEGHMVDFWAPKLTDKIFIGENEFKSEVSGDGRRKLTLVCSTSYEGSGGKFDDADDYIEQQRLGFTSKGLGLSVVAVDEDSFVNAVQNALSSKILEHIK